LKQIKQKLGGKPILAMLFLLGLVGVPLVFNGSYFLLLFCYLTFYSIAVSGLDILVGYSGQMSMGHAAYLCIGAYASAVLHANTGMPVLLCMLLAAIIATVIGTVIAWPATKLVNHFQSLSTIAFALIVLRVVKNTQFLGAAVGYHSVDIRIFGYELDTYTKYYIFMFLVMTLFLIIKQRLVNSRTGRALIAIRENPHAADGMGINVRAYKVLAFSISTFYTGFAGAAYVHLLHYVAPESFVQTVSVMLITMLLFGGSACLMGPIIGVGSVLLLNELLRDAAQYQVFIYGCILLVIIIGLPGGLVGASKDIKRWIQHRLQKKAVSAEGGKSDVA